MKLSISNIAWPQEEDAQVYLLMKKYGYSGLEIAPTRIFPDTPYEHLEEAGRWAERLKDQFGFVIPSMQSIWYGRSENLFVSEEERSALLSYTKQAIDFASAIGCGNLVFGCPRNRNLPDGKKEEEAVPFFRELAAYAAERGTVIGMEANPPVYQTNFINDTAAALRLIREVDSPGFRLNLDVGTMIYNQESVDLLRGNVRLISHVHVSEPGLKPIVRRPVHRELYQLLKEEGYDRFVSIEMGKTESFEIIEKRMEYVRNVFA